MYMTIRGQDFGYYFTTNYEGIYMFQSQHDWSRYGVENLVAILKGCLITAFKIGAYILFLFRMLFMAVLTMSGPLVVVINAFTRVIYGKKYLSSKARNKVKNWRGKIYR